VNPSPSFDHRFSAYINVNNLDSIYRDFFIQGYPNSGSGFSLQEQIEIKNRCFKDLYNILEESVFKFYEIFTMSLSNQMKNEKLEETFN
jgi:hypothetical protein